MYLNCAELIINNYAFWPSCLSTIMPVSHKNSNYLQILSFSACCHIMYFKYNIPQRFSRNHTSFSETLRNVKGVVVIGFTYY